VFALASAAVAVAVSSQGYPLRVPGGSARNVLVVGGAGYIGGWLTDRIRSVGHEVRVFDVLLYEDHYLKEVDFVCGNILEPETLEPHLRWADAVVWLAAMVGDGACALDSHVTRAINVDAVRWLAETYEGRIVFMSTCSVYGAQDDLLTERSGVNPLSLYAQTKLEAEAALRDADAIVFRLGTIYGLGDTYSRIRMDLVLNLLTVKAVLYGRVSVFGGEQYRPLLHVRDVSEAVVPTLFSDHRGIFNLHGTNITIRKLVEQIQKLVPEVEAEFTEMPFEDLRNYQVSSEKAHAAFGFVPRLTADDGIREIATVVTEGRVRDTSMPRYSNLDFLRPLLVPERSPLGVEVIAARPFGSASRTVALNGR
jgi:nucleoside-diphosphate-sugar epimerase